jgi:protein-S-isoprenylcysteine O-methyltransferase Ste14
MHVVDQQILGAVIVLLLATLVAVKRWTTGSILETPPPDPLLWLVNLFNLFFLLIANPLAAILLISGQLEGADPTFVALDPRWLRTAVELGGVIIYLAGFILMGWALMSLRANYQLGGSDPRSTDTLITRGPYALMRHPMYTAALCIAFGLVCMTGSLACLGAFILYLVLILRLIPVEEASLERAYGEQYARYQQNVSRLIPGVF